MEYIILFQLASSKPQFIRTTNGEHKRLKGRFRTEPVSMADNIASLKLYKKAGITLTQTYVYKVYPREAEQKLFNAEMQYLRANKPGKKIRDIRRTIFRVSKSGSGYEFKVFKMEDRK